MPAAGVLLLSTYLALALSIQHLAIQAATATVQFPVVLWYLHSCQHISTKQHSLGYTPFWANIVALQTNYIYLSFTKIFDSHPWWLQLTLDRA